MAKTLYRDEIAKRLSKKSGLTQPEARMVIQFFCDTVIEAISKGEEVQFLRFGTFYPATSASKTVHLHGTPIKSKEQTRISFKSKIRFKK